MSKQGTTRKSSPKVKTGCKTCKIRRVKCDENKPHCLRCTSTGRQCDGYPTSKQNFQIQVWNARPANNLQKTVSTYSQLFGESIIYLEYYHQCVKPTIGNNFDDEFWSRTTLQMAHSEPTVRHALIALGYLHKTEDGTLKHARSSFAAHHESKTLLYHYNKSVGSLIQRMEEPTYLHEVGLVTCLLFICIEFLRGNYHTAFTHLRNGLKIIGERQRKENHLIQSPAKSAVSSPTSQHSSIRPGSSTSHDHLTSYASLTSGSAFDTSRTFILENELKPLFTRAIACALMYGVEVEEVISIPGAKVECYQELKFETVRDVQMSGHDLRNRSIVLVRDLSRSLFWKSNQDLPDGPITAQQLEERAVIITCQDLWLKALEHFESKHKLEVDDEIALSVLKTQYHAVRILTLCATDYRQSQYDAHINDFKTILHHAGRVIDAIDTNSQQTTSKFTFEIGIIPSVYLVATRCRCPTTRRQAVALLGRNPPREGLWDAEQHVVVSNRVIEIEEEEVDPDTGWPVERTRLWSSVIDANMDRNGGFWAYFAPARSLPEAWRDGKPKLLQEFFTLSHMPSKPPDPPLTPFGDSIGRL